MPPKRKAAPRLTKPTAKVVTTKTVVETTTTVTDPQYNSWTLAALKAECNKLGLLAKGKKAELIKRLEDSLDSDEPPAKVRRTDGDEEEAAEPEPTSSRKYKIDSGCNLDQSLHQVYKDYSCMLNQTNIGHNNNKYYVIQLIQDTSGTTNYVFTRWGRVGETGQQATDYFYDTDEAIEKFKKKFYDKTRNQWDKKAAFKPVPGKYTLLEMSGID
ncbi:unnamed protein product [Cyprideis torosa]|uniref:Uncharacterized protein n=1 Tax=Cyprideis torosa TaxID=163714 RepID=A0A7R8W7D3_9CRUS|nr:unnamed protein product [Cyprideis torosa]CAG0887463.1 unnamed protein product [Cyprideis torosa]